MSRPPFARVHMLTVALGVLALGMFARPLAATLVRNLAAQAFAAHLARTAPCAEPAPSSVRTWLEQALAWDAASVPTWRLVLQVMGRDDRAWLASEVRLRLASDPHAAQALSRAVDTLVPPPWSLQDKWSASRCLAAWDIWTVGLVETARGNSTRAVAAYQAGLSLAPGRVPPQIVAEYYGALAGDLLSDPSASPAQRLAAAKYAALAGVSARAGDAFQALSRDASLSAEQRCDASVGLAWIRAGGLAAGPQVPWPPTPAERTGCPGAATTVDPAWQLPPESAIDTAHVLGFDFDEDLMRAGAEVVGVMYWAEPNGTVLARHFRRPNLWPNSGNDWKPLPGFTACLPGYAEPAWVPACASGTTPTSATDSLQGPAGFLHSPWGALGDQVPDAQIPDAYLTVATTPLTREQRIVYGGWWLLQGSWPSPHLARSTNTGDGQYEPVIYLTGAPERGWRRVMGIAAPVAATDDYIHWLRPRFAQGSGMIQFDDIFSFVLPEPVSGATP